MARREVSFASDGLRLAAHLYLPAGTPPAGGWPGLAMAGPMTSVKEETLPHYAVELARAGFATLTFDNRNFGASEGRNPQHLNTAEQIEGLRSAVSYLVSHPDVNADRVGLACVCLGAGRQLEFRTGEAQFLPAVAGPPDYAPSSMPVREAFEYYTRAHDTEAPSWENRLPVRSMEQIIGWNVTGHAHLVTQPLIVVHGTTDVLLPPAYAQQVHDQASSATKEMVWIITHNHVELYDQAPYVPQALAAITPFLAAHLADS